MEPTTLHRTGRLQSPSDLRVRADPDAGVGRRLAMLALLAALVAALLLAVPDLGAVQRTLGHVDPAWIVAAVALELASEVSFVVIFRLFFDRLPGREARAVAWTQLASGALLPAGGVGALAIGGWLIRQAGMSKEWIIRRSGGLFFLTSAVNGAALIVAGAALLAGVHGPHDFLRVALPVLVAAAAILLGAALPRVLGSRGPRWVAALTTGVDDAHRTAFGNPHWRLAGAVGYLVFDIAVLWAALRALGASPNIPALVLAYTIGYLANAVPIPGGIGALDAGLTGALVLYGTASPSTAAAAVLVYHAIALWLPGLGGLYAYLRLRSHAWRAEVSQPGLPSCRVVVDRRIRAEGPA